MQKSIGLRQVSKNFPPINAKYNFNKTTANSWKAKRKVGNATRAGRLNLLDKTLLKKVKDTAIDTRAAEL